jgi:hypothetical protein
MIYFLGRKFVEVKYFVGLWFWLRYSTRGMPLWHSGSICAWGVLRLVSTQQKLSVDWNGQENVSLSCELWVGTNDFNTKKKCSCPFQSTDNFPEWKLAFRQIYRSNQISFGQYIFYYDHFRWLRSWYPCHILVQSSPCLPFWDW